MPRVLVINPNSNDLVTEKLQASLGSYNPYPDTEVDCISIQEGPFGIETDADISLVEPLVVNKINDEFSNYDAFVIACYSDPGLSESRRIFQKPIYGIHEAAVKLCSQLTLKFGVIALGEDSINRHADYIKRLHLEQFYVGEEALNISVNQAVSATNTLDKIIVSGHKLIKEKGAEIIILGCAGMAKHRLSAEKELGVRVIDPVQVSVEKAIENINE